MDRTRRTARQARRRMLAADLVARCGRWALWGGCVGLAAAVAAKVIDIPIAWPWLIGIPNVLAISAAAALELLRPRPLLGAANAVDERLGLKSRLSTAISFADGQRPDPFITLAEAEAEVASARADLHSIAPIRFGLAWGGWPVLAAASVAVALWVPHIDLFGRRAQAIAERERAMQLDALAQEVAEAVKVAQEKPDRIKGATAEQLQSLTQIQQELTKGDAADPQRSAEQAAAALHTLADARDKAAEEAALRQQAMRESLARLPKPDNRPSPLSDALREGDLTRAARDARSIAETAKNDVQQRAEAMQQLEQLARDLRTLEERARVDDDRVQNGKNEMPDAGTQQDSPFSPALREQLKRQGLNENAQQSLNKQVEPEDIAQVLKDAGLPPEPAERLARDIAEENRQRQAREEARQNAHDLADAAEQAARELRAPPPADKTNGNRPQDRLSPQDESPRKNDQPSNQSQSTERQDEQRSSSESKPTTQDEKNPPPRTDNSGSQRQQPAHTPQSSEPNKAPNDPATQSGDRAREQSGDKPQPPAESKPAGQPGEQQQSRANDKPSEPQTGQSQSSQPSQEATPKSQPSTDPQPAAREPSPTEAKAPGKTQDDQQSPQARDQPASGSPRESDAQRPTADPARAPSAQPSQPQAPSTTQRPENVPRQQPSGDAVEKLAERLEKLAKDQQSAAGDREKARDLRDRAEKMLERMSPEQRERMRQWAQEAQKQQSPSGDPARRSQSRAQGRPDGSGAGRAPASSQTADTPRTPAPSRTELIDARTPSNHSTPAQDQTIAQWLGPGGGAPGDRADATAQDAVAQEAVRSAERAIDDRTVPRRFDRLLERYFRRLPDAASSSRQTPPATPAAEPAPDAR